MAPVAPGSRSEGTGRRGGVVTSTESRKAVSDAVGELERRLRPYVPDGNRLFLAEKFIDWLLAEHWRHIPPPVDWKTSGQQPDADTAHRGAELARRALEEGGPS